MRLSRVKKYPGRVHEAETVPGFTSAGYVAGVILASPRAIPYAELEAALPTARISRYLEWAAHRRSVRVEHELADAIRDIHADRKEATASRIVAGLTLGFWTAMFGKAYENLRQQGLHRVAARADGKPIIYSDLHKTHAQILQLIAWLSPPAAAWCVAHSRFRSVCPEQLHLEIKRASVR